jgi:hypothetical protein
MKKIIVYCLLLLCFGLTCLLTVDGCGQQSSGTTTTTVPPTQNIILSGSLSTGTITSGVRATAVAAGYNVVAIDNGSGKTYNGSTDASGNFSLSIPSGISYEVSLIDSNSEYFGPIVMSGNSSSSEVVMGLLPSTDTNLGSIVLDTSPSKQYAKPVVEPTAINAADKAVAVSGKPDGAANDGKTTFAGITTRESGADRDKDGIPNVFDADEDNDGIRNGIISTPIGATVVSNTVESVFLSSNIWARHGSSDAAKDAIAMWINVYAKTGKLDDIASVQCIDIPASIKDVATIRFSTSIGDPIGYPTEGSLWATSGHHLYKTTTLSRNQWIVSLTPRAIMNVGDIFTVRVTYTGGGYQDFFISTSYVLTDWSKILTYNNTTMPTTTGTNSSPEVFSADSLHLYFSKAKDEDGNILHGLTYSIRVGTCEGAAPFGVPANVVETRLTDPGTSYTSVEAIISTVTAETYYITPVAESSGQRNGEETWFTRQ